MTTKNKTHEQLLEDVDLLKAQIAQLKKSEIGRKQTEEILRKSEEQRIATLSLLSDLNDTTKKLQHEINKRRQREESLRTSEEHFRLIFLTSPDAFSITRVEDGMIVDINQGFSDITGYKRDEVIGKLSREINIWADNEDRDRFLDELKQTGQVKNIEFKFRLKDKSIVHGLISARPIELKGVPHLLSIAKSIEELKQAENEIIKSKNEAERYLNIAAEIILTLDTDGNISMLNESGHKLLSYEKGELLGKNWFETCLPKTIRYESSEQFRKLMRKEAESLNTYENQVVTRDGTGKIIRWHNTVLKDDLGQITGTLSSGEDITVQKKTEKALVESEEKYREMVDLLPQIVFEADINGELTFVNNQATEIFGYPMDIIKNGINILQTLIPEDRERAKKSMQYLLNKNPDKIKEYTALKEDGSTFPILIYSNIIVKNSKTIGFRGIVVDITERKQAEESLKQSEEQLRQLTKYIDAKTEKEKKSVARDIHDGLGQLLTGLQMDLQWIEKKWPEASEKLTDKFTEMNNIINTSVKEVQKLSIQLRPKMLDELGLLETLKSEAIKFEKRTGTECNMYFKPAEFEVEYERSSTIYRVLIELLTNIYRHAIATRVDIKLEMKNEKYILTVIDNGTGITQDQIDGKSSFGLMTIIERVNKWDGIVKISGNQNKGTTVEITIPF